MKKGFYKNQDSKKTIIWALLLLLITPYVIYLVPQQLGLDSYVVESSSMAPEMPKGSLVFESWENPKSYEEGDVVIFRPNQSNISEDLVVHRIIDIREGNYTNSFQTKGDANPGPDPGWTSGEQIIGERKFWIPYIGYYIIFTSRSPLIYLFLLIPAVLIIRGHLIKILEALDEEKKEPENQSKETQKIPLKRKSN
ncbi:signal peptidase I [Candidatus Nanohalovita haloferacivicina]|uniref:signal peptidase I n=1 Tax=Candidatus Nanohalovita haloferacivicina TaxID=2978046 RepID=UPI00325FCBA0|nr:Signal peptidase I [Candidatus Nanohalobia archaeon BNXNv]